MHSVWGYSLLASLMVFSASFSTRAATPQPQVLFVTQDNCKRIRGYSRNDLAGVAKAFAAPVNKVSYVKAEWGKGPEGRQQCNMVFNTPNGRTSCEVFNILKTDFIFGQAVPVKGNQAICLPPSRLAKP
jgi:hypothetical protein